MDAAKVSDEVALLVDVPASGLRRGQVGKVVREAGGGLFQVSFKNKQGRLYATLNLRPDQLLSLRYEPAAKTAETPAAPADPTKIAAPPGISGQLTLEGDKTTFRVGEGIWFVETLVNASDQPVKYSYLGVHVVRADGKDFFHTSWGGDLQIDPGCIGPTDRCGGPWRDNVTVNEPGEYQLTLDVNFSDQESARKGIGWAVLTPPIRVAVVQ